MCGFCGYIYETLHHIIGECSKLALREYKTRNDWEGMVIYNEWFKKLKFDYQNKWYTYNLDSVLKNKMQNLLWDFEMQTDHLMSAGQPGIVTVNKKREPADCGLWRLDGSQNKTQRKLKERWVSWSCKGTNKNMEHESDRDTTVIDALRKISKGLVNGWMRRKSEDK